MLLSGKKNTSSLEIYLQAYTILSYRVTEKWILDFTTMCHSQLHPSKQKHLRATSIVCYERTHLVTSEHGI